MSRSLGLFIGVAVCAAGATLLTTSRPAPAQREPIAVGRYEVRMVGGDTRTTFFALRFERGTGRTWRLLNDAWVELPEAGPVAAGEYEVTAVPLATNDFGAVRWERSTGRAWRVTDNRWVAVSDGE